MKTRIIKILVLMLTIILLLGTSQVLAINTEDYKPDISSNNPTIFKTKVGKILGAVNVVGIICSVAVIAVMGIKYMLGSVEEKAEYKKTMTTYLLGAVLLFSGTTIPNIIYDVANPAYVYAEKSTKIEYCKVCNAERTTLCVVNKHAQGKDVTLYTCSYCDDQLTDLERVKQVCEKCCPEKATWLGGNVWYVFEKGSWKVCRNCGELFEKQSHVKCSTCRDKTIEDELKERRFCGKCGQEWNYKDEYQYTCAACGWRYIA